MNPVKEVRTAHKLTMKAFASLAGITEQNVVKAEAGMGASLPPSIVDTIARLTGDPVVVIMDKYEQWIDQELKNVELPDQEFDYMAVQQSTFQNWRENVCVLNDVPPTIVGFAKVFKLHPYVIAKWESGKLKSAPLQLVQRLSRMRGII